METREKNILKNSIIFSIGNLGSKILSYVMVLVYTHFISSSALGHYDIIMTTISLLLPIVMLAFDEGIYRWLIDINTTNKVKIISTCIKTVILSTFISILLFIVICINFKLEYAIEIIFLFSSTLLYQLMLNAVRGLSNNKLYACSGIINSILLLAFEVIGLLVFHMGIDALLISKILANILTMFFLYCKQAEFRGFIKEPFDKTLAKSIIKYTLPLISNQISWWIVNSSDRYIILVALGSSCNGIYTISNKFPTVISIIAGILYLSFQEAIIREYNSADRDKFYSNIFEKYYFFLFSLVLCGVPSTKLVMIYLAGADYTDAWKYIGFLFLGAVFCALSSFLGIGYQVAKETKRSASSTILAAIVNIIVNIALINIIGLHAATLSTLVSYVFLFALRVHHCKKYFTLNINWCKFILLFLVALISVIVGYFGSFLVLILELFIGLLFFIYCNKSFLKKVLSKEKIL